MKTHKRVGEVKLRVQQRLEEETEKYNDAYEMWRARYKDLEERLNTPIYKRFGPFYYKTTEARELGSWGCFLEKNNLISQKPSSSNKDKLKDMTRVLKALHLTDLVELSNNEIKLVYGENK